MSLSPVLSSPVSAALLCDTFRSQGRSISSYLTEQKAFTEEETSLPGLSLRAGILGSTTRKPCSRCEFPWFLVLQYKFHDMWI
ncbi:unnamed protein product [Pleuronectes platessa]|uniref:Uncharacterized protein n=1 Tax=Pleuronectes platessa TaxID=8262 RepID=A0A9N7TUQ5_PLEPL|nr:unnamed protein product [Pleuronectes platessa]